MRQPRRPTLFPYTTLFRSDEILEAAPLLAGLGPLGKLLARFLTVCAEVGVGAAIEDRKSTRLNSSHSSISYAVFCLKKKIESAHPAAAPAALSLRLSAAPS